MGRFMGFAFLALAACGGGSGGDDAAVAGSVEAGTPSDDPADRPVDTSLEYVPVLSAPKWIVPSAALPVATLPSNNNCAIAFHEGRLFLAWRTAETHFASANAKLHVVSSLDQGATWEFEKTVALGADVREPSFLSIGGKLILHYMELGTNPLAFEPKKIWRSVRTSGWSAPETVFDPGEVPWDLKVRGGKAWMTSYLGNHYGSGASEVTVRFRSSPDGLAWSPPLAVYKGGASEVAFEFDIDGKLWAVTRNEDGDATGWGSHVAVDWQFPAKSDPERYDSPELIRHGKDLYLIARRDIGGPFDLGWNWLPWDVKKAAYLAAYSFRPKRTALYAIDKVQRRVVHLADLPSAGDTAFPCAWRAGPHTFLIVNYSSPVPDPGLT